MEQAGDTAGKDDGVLSLLIHVPFILTENGHFNSCVHKRFDRRFLFLLNFHPKWIFFKDGARIEISTDRQSRKHLSTQKASDSCPQGLKKVRKNEEQKAKVELEERWTPEFVSLSFYLMNRELV